MQTENKRNNTKNFASKKVTRIWLLMLILFAALLIVARSKLFVSKEEANQPTLSTKEEPIKVTAGKSTDEEPLEEDNDDNKDADSTRRRRRRETQIQVGQTAPDFKLPSLTIETNKEGKNVGKVSTEKVVLSSFRGKRPVCLIFASYT